MILEFKVLELGKDTKQFKSLKAIHKRIKNPNREFVNEFIVVGSESSDNIDYYKVQQLSCKGLVLIGGLKLDEISLIIPKSDFIWDGVTYTEIDIPKEYLDIDIIETIQNLNSIKES